MKKIVVIMCGLILCASVLADSHKNRRSIYEGPDPRTEYMRWATGGICSNVLDCTVTGQNFCNQHGGVKVLAWDGGKLDDWSCNIRCMDNTIGHTECAITDFGSIGTKDDDDEDPPVVVGDPCDPDFVGPPDPDHECPCDGVICT